MKSLYLRLFAGAGAAILLCSPSVVLATGIAPTLGAADSFGILGASGVTNTGATVVNGDLGISPNGLSSVTGFTFSTSPGPGVVTGTTHFADVLAGQAQADTTTAYNALASQACDSGPSAPTDLVGQTLFEGVYCFSSSVSNTGTLTLDAQNNSDAVWVFEIGSTLITGPGSSVVLTNGAQACNVFWQVGSSATLDTTTTFVGNILALTSITMNNGATLNGRALARNAAVTMDDNSVTVATCAAGHTDRHSNCTADRDANGNGDRNSRRTGNGIRTTLPPNSTATETETSDANSDCHRNSDRHSVSDPDRHVDGNGDRNRNRDANSDCHRNSDRHSVSDPNRHVGGNGDRNGNRDANSSCDRDADRHSLGDADRHAERDPIVDRDSNAAADHTHRNADDGCYV